MTLGQKIQIHRKEIGLTQTELGEKLGVKKNAVSKWECGRVESITASKLKTMAELFGVKVSYLIDEDTPSGGRAEWEEAWEKATPEKRQAALAVLRL